jgi:hypothetical protein
MEGAKLLILDAREVSIVGPAQISNSAVFNLNTLEGVNAV